MPKGNAWHANHRRILLEVRESNLPAQLFLRAQGFRAIATRRDFYDESPEAAYVMTVRTHPPQLAGADATSGSRGC